MPVTPDALFEAAKALGRGGAEVDRRNAASRAYYAAYHRCLPIGRSLGLSAAPAHGVHRQLVDTLTESSDLKMKGIGYRLNECRKLRAQADYEIESDFSSRDARLVVEQCERILGQVDALAR